MDLRNVIFAIALSFAVLFGWSVIFESPQVDQAKTGQAENRMQSQNSDTPNVNLEGVVSKNISRDEALKSVERINFENENVKYFHCVAKYPHTFEEAMEVMPEKFDDRLIGYSDHTVGNEACEEAVRRGAKVLEKHFTIDYNLQCKTESAHICSMNFGELIRLRSFCDSLNVST